MAVPLGQGSLREEWDALADRVGAPLFARPGWYEAWWPAFGRGTPQVETTYRDGGLVGVAALERRGPAVESMTNWHTVEYDLLAEDDAAAGELARAIFARRPRRASFAFMTAGESAIDLLRSTAEENGYRTIRRTLEQSPYVPIDGEWDTYRAGRERRLLSEIGRRRRRLEAEAPVRFELLDGRERLAELLDEGLPLEASGWKAEQGTAILSDPSTLAFYTSLARYAAGRGALRLAFLRLGERPIAFQFLIEDSDTLYFLKGGFETEYRKLGPGAMLIEEVLAYAFARRLRSYEFLGFPEPFKLDWTDRLRERDLLQAFAPSAAGVVDWTAWAVGRPLAKRAMSALKRAKQ